MLSWFTIALVAIIVLVLLALAALEYGPILHDFLRSMGVPEDVFVALLILIILVPPGLLALYMRNLFLIARLEEVLKAKTMCHACGYSLIGVPVSSAGDVTCPECGFTITIDPALDDLTRDQAGFRVFEPKEP